ncbi:MAG: CPBP family intramembrane metalloprotease [Anaerolineales bacterium]|nr:CPBP family intramembrane metalloprotease [Anaerolineales bacterium]
MSTDWSGYVLLLVVSLALVVSGGKRQPGIGILFALAAIGLLAWGKGLRLASFGIYPLTDMLRTVLLGLLSGVMISLVGNLLIEPLANRLTNSTIDLGLFDPLRGNLKLLLVALVGVWLTVPLIEELIFRGYLMMQLEAILGDSHAARLLNLVYTSLIFGLAHWYQGKSGALSTGLLGTLLGLLMICSGFNLWLPMLAHGFIDTLGLILIYLNADRILKVKWSDRLWKRRSRDEVN